VFGLRWSDPDLDAHKAECLENRARTRDLIADLRISQKDSEDRLSKALSEVANRFALEQSAHHVDNQRRFDKLEDQVNKITGKLAMLIAGVAVFGWVVEHFHIIEAAVHGS
jgi:hypothetical protein